MSDTVISVENLSKSYLIGHDGPQERYHSLRDTLVRHGKNYVRKAVDMARGRQIIQGDSVEEFWAIKGVSFEVKRGEVLGIIGRNGAGKSTLLKILSRITEPTQGRVVLDGRVASLLEVGTGFHPELTGRENIFLNGAILGMTRTEIKKKFDEIVTFAEVEKFLDTPVKRYSSGMYVRLAFAVAAHLEPEILIVDEVLAVGDAQFQAKCLGKIKEISQIGGRTVLFVSHNMGAIQSLCDRSIMLDRGTKLLDDNPRAVVARYMQHDTPSAVTGDLSKRIRVGTGEARISSIRFLNDGDEPQTHFCMGEPMKIAVTVNFHREVMNPTFGVNIVTDTGIRVADCRSSHYDVEIGPVRGEVSYVMRVPNVLLFPRTYYVEPWVADAGCLSDFDWVREAASCVVTCGPNFRSGANMREDFGISYIETEWSVNDETFMRHGEGAIAQK
jgi:ABC-type polysaccharide/polyol phosphate transport system ATPase subunit